MSKKDINSKYGHNVPSNIVRTITDSSDQDNFNIGTNVVSVAKNHSKGGNKVGSIIILLFIIITIVSLIILICLDCKKDESSNLSTNTNKTIYEEAYENMNFREDPSLKKLSCSKKIPNDNVAIQEQETLVYYFFEENIEISIYHTDISLSNEYNDYFDKIYNEHEKSLKTDYDYDNVDTNITRRDNEMLITVITYAKRDGKKKLGIKPFLSYDDAKVAAINDGYICE